MEPAKGSLEAAKCEGTRLVTRGTIDLSLKGRRILILDDEYFIATMYAEELRARGAEIVGPIDALSEGLASAEREPLDTAILDVLVQGGSAYPVARILLDRGIPVVIATGLPADSLPRQWRHVKIFQKPFDMDDLVKHIVVQCVRAEKRAAE